MKKILTRFAFCLMCIGSAAFAQDTRYAGAFLELGIGARGIALGGAYAAVADDASAFYWNPAGVTALSGTHLSGMYASLFQGLVKHYHIGLSRPLRGDGAISINWVRLSVPEVPRYDSPLLLDPNSSYASRVAESGDDPYGFWNQFALTDAPLDFSDANDDALFITLSKNNKINLDFGWQYFVMPITIPIGANVKLIRQSLFGQRGSGVGLDLGTMLKFGLDDLLDNRSLGKLSFGLAVKDVWNTRITWDTATQQGDRIKRSWHLGGAYLQPLPRISGQLMFAYSLEKKYGSRHNIGLEYMYYNRLAIRFGLTDGQFTAGVGIKLAPFLVDYAFRSHELGGSHRINTSLQL